MNCGDEASALVAPLQESRTNAAACCLPVTRAGGKNERYRFGGSHEQPVFRQGRSGDPAGPTTLLLMAIASRTRRPRINRSRGHTGIATPIIGWRAAGSAGGTDEDGTRNVIG